MLRFGNAVWAHMWRFEHRMCAELSLRCEHGGFVAASQRSAALLTRQSFASFCTKFFTKGSPAQLAHALMLQHSRAGQGRGQCMSVLTLELGQVLMYQVY